MRTRWVAVAGLAFVLFASTGWSAERINQKVLYTGDPKSDRTADFRSFLEKHFTRVGLADYLSLRQADTKGYDVIILDWPDLPPREDGVFKVPALGRDYDRPTILIGGGTLGVGRSQQLKLDDLCLCLGDAAHGIVTTHEIFHTPNEVRLTFEIRQVPVYYRSWPIGERLGETMKVWRVQKRGWSAQAPGRSFIPAGNGLRPLRLLGFAGLRIHGQWPQHEESGGRRDRPAGEFPPLGFLLAALRPDARGSSVPRQRDLLHQEV